MNPTNPILTPDVSEVVQPIPSKKSFYKKKLTLVCSALILLLAILTTIFLLLPVRKNIPVPQASVTPKTWQIEITFNPQSHLFTVTNLTLINKRTIMNKSTISPYMAEVLDAYNKVLSAQPVTLATHLIIPDVFKNSSAEASLANTPLTSIINIPYVPNGSIIRIKTKNAIIKDIKLSASVSSVASLLNNAPAQTESQRISSTQGTSPSGWKLTADPICQDNKAFISYSYSIPRFAGVIFTYDNSSGTPESSELMKDSSWERLDQGLILLSGTGNYIATGNLINWNHATSPGLKFNGPVGFAKGNPYEGTLMLSGDFRCDIEGTPNNPGCVPAETPPPGYEETVTIDFTSDSLSECPDKIIVPTPTPTPTPGSIVPTATPTPTPTKAPPTGGTEIKCTPDPACMSGETSVQVCQFICK